MISEKNENLIVKYMSKSATEMDLDILLKWIKNPANMQLFKDYVQIHYAINFSLNDPDTRKLKEALLREIRKDKSIYKLQSYFKYAAAIVLFLGLAYSYQQGFFKGHNQLVIENEYVTLELENGKVEVIIENEQKEITDNKGNEVGHVKGNQINYKSKKEIEKLVYNELTIPYGKRFDLILSDGTKVKLNSGSSIKYPQQFINGKDRKVFLKGEAFFEVAKDMAHPFIVNTDELNIRVLGTKFNVSSYLEDEDVNTVLVEGSVSLYEKGEKFNSQKSSLLDPGHKAEWNKIQALLSIEKVDTSIYTGWMEGKIVFDHLPFENILKKLERHYNVSIICNDVKLNKEKFTATFDIETIEQILNSFNKNYKLNFVIENNQIIINQPKT